MLALIGEGMDGWMDALEYAPVGRKTGETIDDNLVRRFDQWIREYKDYFLSMFALVDDDLIDKNAKHFRVKSCKERLARAS